MTAHHAVDAYLATWNARGEQLTKLVAEHWASDATYTDPLAEVAGHTALVALIEGVHEQFPGFVFTAVGDVDAHHRQLRFQWGLGPEGAEPPVIGFDVLVLDEAGRIQDVRGFLDKVPAA
ncbi:nuclear transport factor 2 family protein [Streptomyces sp. BH097]|uniref:nuclear transport factor 2 family protein n=1 Tax=unclassified Streptomyces TaxID=2593676 RepID=UPI003BB72E72